MENIILICICVHRSSHTESEIIEVKLVRKTLYLRPISIWISLMFLLRDLLHVTRAFSAISSSISTTTTQRRNSCGYVTHRNNTKSQFSHHTASPYEALWSTWDIPRRNELEQPTEEPHNLHRGCNNRWRQMEPGRCKWRATANVASVRFNRVVNPVSIINASWIISTQCWTVPWYPTDLEYLNMLIYSIEVYSI